MNELSKELEAKAQSLLKETLDPHLNEAAFHMLEAVKCINSYECTIRKESVTSESYRYCSQSGI
ncbi:MAG: hypothetical protein EOM67_16210 [Spirochaetia bacterium]|nr:hypothetical protein [Spirochaetia bacterium]